MENLWFTRQMATVPNNIFGRLFIWYFKRHLNKRSWRLQLRGRGKAKYGHRDRYGLSALQGSKISIYLNESPKHRAYNMMRESQRSSAIEQSHYDLTVNDHVVRVQAATPEALQAFFKEWVKP